MNSSQAFFTTFLALPLFFSVLGCQGEDTSLQVVPFEGEVRLNGKPIAGASVVFHPLDSSKASVVPTGTTDQEGKFRLSSMKEFDGAPAGEYKVSITWFRSLGNPSKVQEGDETVRNFLPGYLANPDTSRLIASVGPELSQSKTFDLRFSR